MAIIWCTGMAQGDADAGLDQEWPREPDASAKEAQVGRLGRVLPEGEMALPRGSVWTGPDQNDPVAVPPTR